MPNTTWKYLENQFETSTRRNCKKMLTLCADHDARLFGRQGDPLILPLYTRFHAQHLAYTGAYTVWQGSLGSYEGETGALEQKLEELSAKKARQWDVKVQGVFDKDTPEYAAIFPAGRAPFQNGTRDQRIAAVGTLHLQLAAQAAALPAVFLAEVQDYHGTLVAVRTAQQAREGAADDGSTFLERSRVATARLLYANLGLLMDIYHETPWVVADFFELSLIRRKGDPRPGQG